MSKKMSIQDMKEVKKIIANLLASSLSNNPVISCSIYHGKPSFRTEFNYNSFDGESKKRMKTVLADIEEISKMQDDLLKKKVDLIRKLTQCKKSDLEDEDDDYTERTSREYDLEKYTYSDIFSVLENAERTVESILEKRTREFANKTTEEFNEYFAKIESRVFDAYTKGMSADDFLDVVREEIKELQTKAQELAEEIKKNGYNAGK